MTKYCIINFSRPNLKTGTAYVHVLCNCGYSDYWTLSSGYFSFEKWYEKEHSVMLFDTKEKANKYIENAGLENCISYGVEVE